MNKTDNWESFGNEYLKAIEVTSDLDEYFIIGVDSEVLQGKDKLQLIVERNKISKKFTCNATNLYAIQAECPKGPKQSIGRVITFNKVKAQKPGTDETVDSLRIVFKPIEQKEPSNVDTDSAGINEDGSM